MRKIGYVALTGLVLTTLSSARADQPQADIMTVFGNYIAAAVAADKCDVKDTSPDQKFLQNLTVVSLRASKAIKERTNLPDEKIVEMFKNNTDKMKEQVAAFVDKNGCGSDQVSNLLKIYKQESSYLVPKS